MNTELAIDDLRLDPIPVALRPAAVQALEQGDICGFFLKTSNVHSLWLLFQNWQCFQRLGLFEQALLDAFTGTRINNHHMWSVLPMMFHSADRKRLRDAGQPFPGAGPPANRWPTGRYHPQQAGESESRQ